MTDKHANDIATIKQGLRENAGKLRDGLNEADHKEKSAKIMENIKAMPEWENSGIIYTYVAMGKEPYTPDLIDAALADGKRVCVPRIFGKEMRFIEIRSLKDLHPGTWGIQEPEDKGVYEDAPGLVIVPGVVFGEDFVRVGYGAGYYDRYFEGHRSGDGWILVAVGYEFQVYPALPAEEFDVYMDALVTEERVLRKK